MIFKIVNTDDYGGDYPNERYVEGLPVIYNRDKAQAIADAINAATPEGHDRWFKVVEEGYSLQAGFQP